MCPLVKHIRTSLLGSDILLSFYGRETSYNLSLVKRSYGVGRVMVTRQGRAPESCRRCSLVGSNHGGLPLSGFPQSLEDGFSSVTPTHCSHLSSDGPSPGKPSLLPRLYPFPPLDASIELRFLPSEHLAQFLMIH